ncbi:MAG: CHC2 zinc finger domain-containing protein [Solirubrobacteraceae bacterium]
MLTAADSPAVQLDRYLRMIVGDRRSDEFLEIRYGTGDGGMRRRFISVQRPHAAARAIRSLSSRTDVYCGVVLRAYRAGGRDAVSRSHLAFVEIDAPDALDRLHRFARAPTMIVSSGTSGHAHAYWTLRTRVGVAELEQVNRTLASHLGADLASTDAARILRPAGTLSYKHRPPARVDLLHLDAGLRYELPELVDGLASARSQRPAAGRERSAHTQLDELLLTIPATTYVRELTGLEPHGNGKVSCPFHEDDTPSLHLYTDGTFYCYGCAAGGSIYDFASHLWSLDTKGRGFLELRARLASSFGLRASPTAG